MALPGKKFADVVVARFTKKPANVPETPAVDNDDMPPGAKDDDGPEAGAQGKIALAAVRRSDAEAFEEAIRAICGK